jgi:hypothetical protein
MPKTRKERRRRIKNNYLSGKVRKSYTHGPLLNNSLEGDAEQPGPSGVNSSVCTKCSPILTCYSDKGLVHQGSELKKWKHLNPHPKRPDMTHYRDLNRQTDWMRENLFDPMGNYLYRCPCIRATLGVSRQRLAPQRCTVAILTPPRAHAPRVCTLVLFIRVSCDFFF